MTTSLNTLDINVNNIDFDNGIRATLVIDNQTINISIPKDEVDKLIGESNSSMTGVDKPTVVVDKIIGDSNADMTGVDKPTNEEIQEQRVPEEIQEQSVPEGTQEESNENNQKLSAIFENIIANEVLKYIKNNSTQIDKDNLKDDIEKLNKSLVDKTFIQRGGVPQFEEGDANSESETDSDDGTNSDSDDDSDDDNDVLGNDNKTTHEDMIAVAIYEIMKQTTSAEAVPASEDEIDSSGAETDAVIVAETEAVSETDAASEDEAADDTASDDETDAASEDEAADDTASDDETDAASEDEAADDTASDDETDVVPAAETEAAPASDDDDAASEDEIDYSGAETASEDVVEGTVNEEQNEPKEDILNTLINKYLELTDKNSDENQLIYYLSNGIRNKLHPDLVTYESNLEKFKKDVTDANDEILRLKNKGLKDSDGPVVKQLNKRKNAQDNFYRYLKNLKEKLSDIKSESLYIELVANFDDIVAYLDNLNSRINTDFKIVESIRETETAAASRKMSSGITRRTGAVTKGLSSLGTGFGRTVRSLPLSSFFTGGITKKKNDIKKRHTLKKRT